MAGRRRKKNRINKKRIFMFLISLCFILGIPAYYAGDRALRAEATEIMPGVKVNGVSLSNLERQDGIKRLAQLEIELQNKAVQIAYNGKTYHTTLGELGLNLDNEKTVDQALNLGKKIGVLGRLSAKLHEVDRNLEPVINLDLKKTSGVLQNIAGALEAPAVNAKIEITNSDIIIIKPSKDGFKVDEKEFSNQLINQVQQNEQLNLNLPVKILKPELTAETVRAWGITGVVAQFTTNFNPEQTNRNHNIAVAAGALDGLTIKPGESVSFNKVVGPRGAGEGYKSAGVIVGNKLEQGLGGGVCQVSTTLYNTVLLADLEILHRSSHSLPVSYVPVGRDAAVSYGSLDFVFKNSTANYLIVKTSVWGNTLNIKLFGNEKARKNVRLNSWITKTLEPEIIYKIDSAVAPGQPKLIQKGAKGYKVAAERVVTAGNEELKREPLPASYYQPVEEIVAVNNASEVPGPENDGQTAPENPDKGNVSPVTPESSKPAGPEEPVGTINPAPGGAN